MLIFSNHYFLLIGFPLLLARIETRRYVLYKAKRNDAGGARRNERQRMVENGGVVLDFLLLSRLSRSVSVSFFVEPHRVFISA